MDLTTSCWSFAIISISSTDSAEEKVCNACNCQFNNVEVLTHLIKSEIMHHVLSVTFLSELHLSWFLLRLYAHHPGPESTMGTSQQPMMGASTVWLLLISNTNSGFFIKFTQNLKESALFFQVWTTSGSEILIASASSSKKSKRYLTAIGTASAPGAYPMGTWTPGEFGKTAM